jgi:NADPH-dependent 2,4-dienoyl-CoA reductase/sulfur reductase-like enzyme
VKGGFTRRGLGCLAAAACLGAAAPARPAARVVVIGGGAGGATVARYLAMSGRLDVTLVEPKQRYTTCFYSNLYLAGLCEFDALNHGYENLATKYGIRVVHDRAVAIDATAKRVRLAEGGELAYDRLVVSPGIAFKDKAIAGYDEAAMERMPHAWMAGAQTVLLRRQLQEMEDGGVFIIAAPPEPFRCPPGPYERASLVALYFKRKNPRAKILILDAKDVFFEQDLFQEAWNRHYPGMIEWLPAQFIGAIEAVDPGRRSVRTEHQDFKGNVVNVIPPQTAGRIAIDSGLAEPSGWCPIDPDTFESTLHRGIHVVGDAIQSGAMPKSAFAANSQAKACAFAIIAALTGADRSRAFLYNTCYTYLADDDVVSDAITFNNQNRGIAIDTIEISRLDENAAIRAQSAREADAWYQAFTHDIFG